MANPESPKPQIEIGAAPIAWRNDDWPAMGGETTFKEIVDDMAATGYTGTEIGNAYSRQPDILLPELQKRGLRVANAWHSTHVLEPWETDRKDFIKSRDFLSAMGARVIGVSEQSLSIQGMIDRSLADRNRYTDEQWKEVAERLNKMGLLAQEKNIDLTYHHHMGTPVQTGEEIDQLMEMTDPNLVYLLWDSGHLDFAGEDPEGVLRRHLDRIKHIHLKDVRHDRRDQALTEGQSFYQAITSGDQGVFTVPGDGDIDFDPIFDVIKDSGFNGWMIVEAEQDPKKADPHINMLAGREYVLQHAGV